MTAFDPAILEQSSVPLRITLRTRIAGRGRIFLGGAILVSLVLACVCTLRWTLDTGSSLHYNNQSLTLEAVRQPPSRPVHRWFGTDALGRSLLGRTLLGGAVSMLIGISAAAISVVLGVSVGLIAGYRRGLVDAFLMRAVDILYGLPYILMVILLRVGLEPILKSGLSLKGRVLIPGFRPGPVNLIVLFLAIGLVSWLTMARVIRGQVLSLRAQPFIEAARASGITEWRIFTRHLLPNLVGPIVVYASLIVPQAILQESFLSFLGIGIAAPMPTWGSLASDGLMPALNSIHSHWWMLLFPCILLAVTLLSLNFVGDGLRDLFDPRREAAKI